jgi:hypothetical protein
MVRIKPSDDYSKEKFEFYDGPPPPAGTYQGKVKKMGLAKIASGENKGADRIALVLEITQGKYKGAGILHSLNLTKQGSPFVNQFLESMTDGSEKQKKVIVDWFWNKGYDVQNDSDGKLGRPINWIGSPKFVPVGKTCAFMTRMGTDQQGEPRAEIARFVVPVEDSEEDFASNGSSSDGLEEFAPETTSNPEPELASVSAESEPSPLEDDSDDPWS